MLEDEISAVRKRPGMYVGNTDDGSGVLHCVLELVGNAVDQHFAGRCRRVHVDVRDDGEIVVSDDGPGIPAEMLERVLGAIHDTPTADGHAPHVHLMPGLRAAGIAVVNFLSSQFEVRTVNGGHEHRVLYRDGLLIEPRTSTPTTAPTGTVVAFRPDKAIFAGPSIQRGALSTHLEDLSYLLADLDISWSIGADPATRRGLAALVELEVGASRFPIAHGRGRVGDIDVEVAYGWLPWHSDPKVHGFANFGRNRERGTHVAGLLDALDALRKPRRRDLETGLVAAVAVVLADVRYGSPTTGKVVNEDVRAAVRAVGRDVLTAWAAANPEACAALLARSK